MSAPLWEPQKSNSYAISELQRFAKAENYQELHSWSVRNSKSFWSYVFTDSGVIGSEGALNVVDTLLQGEPSEIVLTQISESGDEQKYSRGEVRKISNQVANKLQKLGIGEGDVVAAITANVAETLFFALGTLRIGAIFTSMSADFGAETVLDRFTQVSPQILLATLRYQYNGKDIECRDKLAEIVSSLPSLRSVIVCGGKDELYEDFHDWIASADSSAEISLKGKFDRPGFILFSSGTTGKPKCIVHSAAGVLLKVLSEQRYHLDVREKDQIFYYTTCGWMMWNWLVMGLGTGASIFLYEGNPAYPNPDRLFDIADKYKLTFLGVSAKFIDSIRKSDLHPIETHKLENLRTIASTGSVLSPEGFSYIYSHVAKDVHLASITGGTDICGCFLLGNPTLPVFAGQIQVPALGLDVQIYDESAKLVKVGDKGELVCLNTFPSMPLYFWDDPDGAKYKNAYFEKFAGVWTHGDYVEPTVEGGYIMHGRSDATLNAGGIRIGTAEIYRIVEQFPEIEESLAVAQEWEGDTRIILFLKLRSGSILSNDLESQIRVNLRKKASPRHLPAIILVAPDLPRTKSNKLVEIAVARAINGHTIDNLNSLANPESITWFKNLNL